MSMAVMMACVCVGVSSCSDDDDNPATSKKVSKLELTLNAQLSNDLKEVAVINFHVQQTAGNTSNGEDLFTQKANTLTVTANGVPATFQLTLSNFSKKTGLTVKSDYNLEIKGTYSIKATFDDNTTANVSLSPATEFEYGTKMSGVTDMASLETVLQGLKKQIEEDFKRTISVEMDKNGNVVGTVTQK